MILSELMSAQSHQFWPDSLTYRDADMEEVLGYLQVTDAYLVSLARDHGLNARLATFDKALVQHYPQLTTLLKT